MANKTGLLLIGLGAAALLATSGKKPTKKEKKLDWRKMWGKCDPLMETPPGMACIDIDGEFYYFPADVDPDELVAIDPDQVAFSANFENYKIGNTWRQNVLDNFLNQQMMEGNLVVRGIPESFGADVQNVLPEWMQFLDNKFGESYLAGEGPIQSIHKKMMKDSAKEAFNRFSAFNNVQSPAGPLPIKNLPDTSAAKEFKGIIRKRIEKFQMGTF